MTARNSLIQIGRPRRASTRRKVVLYNPRAVFFTMPLGLLAVGSHLDPAQYEVVIVDGRLKPDPEAALREHLTDALCLGVSVLTGNPIRDAIKISRSARAARPDLPIIWGGWHPSLFGCECLAETSVDITVQAQGEETFAEIVRRIDEGQSMEGCEGCAYRSDSGEVRLNAPRAMNGVSHFRAHNYGLLPVEEYFRLKGKRQIDYISSQGCHFRCAFCADPFVYGRKWTGLDPERMGEEIRALWRAYRFDDLNFQDETFFTRVERVDAVAEEFLRRRLPITWAATMRADQGDRLPEAVMAKCRQSGLRRVLIGVESGSQEMIDRIRKDIKLAQVFASADKCRRHDVGAIFPFIVGFPDESEVSVQASFEVAKRLRSLSPRFTTPFFYFKPYPGSSITEDAVRKGYRLPDSLEEWADFDFVGSAGPWVSPEKYQRVERFKFYQQIAWDRVKPWSVPIQKMARWRCAHNRYGFPLEKVVSEWIRTPQKLS
ncbi:MAG TPA: radical SAM protein [Armatimonadota bacterium]|nr:radical SAM protein [Armatimonadota bacterium]